MNVLEGPRRELRRILHQGTAYWATPEGEALRLADGRLIAEENVAYLAPCDPTKIMCVHLNYQSRAYEFLGETSFLPTPTYFMKPITSLNGHRGELVRPEGCQYLNYEGEVAVVIGRITRNIEAQQAWDHILGFAPANDAGLHDLRETDAGSMFRTKGADTLCPIGPGLISGIDIREETLRTFRNGVLVQETPVADMVYGIDYLIADIARYITLLPGDVILSGTPANSRPLDVGDLIEVDVTGVGRLSNRVVSAPAPMSDCGFHPFDGEETRRVALGVDDRLSDSLRGSSARARAARGSS